MTTSPLRLGISRCLLGEEVRFDGGHKRDTFLTEVLGRYVEWVPVCPEVEAGLGTPREAMRLVGDPQRSPTRDDQEWDRSHTRPGDDDQESYRGTQGTGFIRVRL